MSDAETSTDENLQDSMPKYKAEELVDAKRGSQKRIAALANRSKGHISLIFSGKRAPSRQVRRATAEVLRVAQRDLVFPTDEHTDSRGQELIEESVA